MADIQLSPVLQSALAAIRGTTAGMTDEQMAWHPEGKWSSAEILEHLALAYSLTADRMKSLLHQGLPEGPRRTFAEWIGGVIVLKLGHIPSGRKSPETLLPNGMNPGEAKSCIEENLSDLDAAIAECEKRFGGKTSILVHPGLGPLSTSAWRRFHCVHTLHHMKQIRVLRKRMGAGSRIQTI